MSHNRFIYKLDHEYEVIVGQSTVSLTRLIYTHPWNTRRTRIYDCDFILDDGKLNKWDHHLKYRELSSDILNKFLLIAKSAR